MSGNGDMFMCEESWAALASELGLSPRQRQIARSLMAGATDKQVAEQLGLALPTVRTHLSRLFGKLKVDDRTDMMLLFFKEYCGHHCPKAQTAPAAEKLQPSQV